MIETIQARIDVYAAQLRRYLEENAGVLAVLASVAVAAYGFELFNLNLSIDEEVQAFLPYGHHYISHGRWGLYLLNKFLLPYPVIPFVPLFVALVFHVGAVLLVLHCWGVESRQERIVAGALGVAFPGMAYFYMFSISNYALGIGLFCTALSLFLFTSSPGRSRFLSVIPGALALSIYQGLAVALACVFLVHIISSGLRTNRRKVDLVGLIEILFVGLLSAAVYFVISLLFLYATGISISYVDQFTDFAYLRDNTLSAVARTLDMARRVYSGSPAVYANEIRSFGVVVVLSLCGVGIAILRSSLTAVHKVLVLMSVFLLLLLPFAAGLFSRGDIPVRFMVALPMVIAGIAALGVRGRGRGFKTLMGLFALYCTFQFIVSVNYLNSSSHLSLQADRVLAAQVIGRVEEARAAAGIQDIKYLEVVGYKERPATKLMPKPDTFGASFFEWDQGHSWRIIFFLRTLGYYTSAEAVPAERRGQLFQTVTSMPGWPAPGSVRIEGDAAIIKFGDYSPFQKKEICGATHRPEFCE